MAFLTNIPILLILCLAVSEIMGFPDQRRLYDELFMGYNRGIIPKTSLHSSVGVKLGLTLNSLIDLDPETKVASFQAWLSMAWKDPALQWQPNDYGNITNIRVPAERIWVPDITGYNTVGKMETESPEIAVISSNGDVFYSPKITIRTVCLGSDENMTCPLKFGSWVYSGQDLDLQEIGKPGAVDLSNYSSETRYTILSAVSKRNVQFYTCCPEPYIDLAYVISFAENSRIEGNGIFNGMKSYFWN